MALPKVQCLACYAAGAPALVRAKALYGRDSRDVFRRCGWLLSCGHVKLTTGPAHAPVKEQ